MNCNGCTKCCEAIALNKDVTLCMTENSKGDVGFVRDHFTEITQEEAFRINPKLKRWRADHKFFTCEFLGENGCTNYDNRPQMCSGYPFYGAKPSVSQLAPGGDYADDCVYFVGL